MRLLTLYDYRRYVRELEIKIDHTSRMYHEKKRKLDKAEAEIEDLKALIEKITSGSAYQAGFQDALRQCQAIIDQLQDELEKERERHEKDLRRTRTICDGKVARVQKKEKERYDRNLQHKTDSHTEKVAKLLDKISSAMKKIEEQAKEYEEQSLEIQFLKQENMEKDRRIREMENDPAQKSSNEELRKKDEEIAAKEEELDRKNREIQRMKAQMNKDSTNSSIPSSQDPNHKKIHNSREKTGRKPGGQPGHQGHKRRDLPADSQVILEMPKEVAADPQEYVLLPGEKSRKVVSAVLSVEVTEYVQKSWKNSRTGEIVRSEFPAGCINEISYDPSIKALLCLLTNNCHVSIRKAQELIREVSRNRLIVSEGMICNLTREFSIKSKEEKDEIIRTLREGPWMHIDTTYTRVNGKNGYIDICTSPDATQYTYGDHKGTRLAEQTAANGFEGILIHDCEPTFFNHGSEHQICLVHIERDLKGVMENESELNWPKQMYELLNGIAQKHKNSGLSEDEIRNVRERYDQILETARQEYGDRKFDPSVDYVGGINLYKRLEKHKDKAFTFLKYPDLPSHNNAAEREAREMKRKTHQSDGFRSAVRAQEMCDVKSVLQTTKKRNENIFQKTVEIFSRV